MKYPEIIVMETHEKFGYKFKIGKNFYGDIVKKREGLDRKDVVEIGKRLYDRIKDRV